MDENNGHLDTLFNHSEPGYMITFGAAQGSNAPQRIVYFQLTRHSLDSNLAPSTAVWAYDLDQDSVIWKTPYIFGQTPHGDPVLHDNRLYTFTWNRVYCYDAQTGVELWRHIMAENPIEANFTQGDALIYKDYLICKPNHEILFALNRFSGQVEWINRDAGNAGFGGMSFYDGMVYYANGQLYGHNADNGKLIYYEDRYGKMSETPVIDTVNGHIYLNNYHEALCFKLPEFDGQ
jgi:outer membrane protein assembly factor BamB